MTAPTITRVPCRSCKAPVIFALNPKTGKTMPYDAAPVPPWATAAFVLRPSPNGTLAYSGKDALAELRRIHGGSEATAYRLLESCQWRTSHFASCPAAEENRRR